MQEVALVSLNELVELRLHGRGGQGAVTSAEILAEAAVSEGKYAQAFPSFGPERRGAPVQAFVRVDAKNPIRTRTSITTPDVVVVLDPGLLKIVDVTSGLKKDGILIINTTKKPDQIRNENKLNFTIATISATKIAQEILGVNIVNTTMIGSIIKATGLVDIESLVEPITKRFGRLAEKNIQVLKQAFEETVIEELSVDKA
jgi:pyruvate ferredoxin oxidoreductase gamma subunit